MVVCSTNPLFNLLIVITHLLCEQWKDKCKISSVEIIGKNELFFCFTENSFFRLIQSSFQKAGLDNNNSFYCPSTSGGAPASCCAVSLNFILWSKTKRERARRRRHGGGAERMMETHLVRPPSHHTSGGLGKSLVGLAKTLEILSHLLVWNLWRASEVTNMV